MTGLTVYERGTRILFGKPYHWHKVDGVLSLAVGKADECDGCDQ